jgi:hypothetical protein
MTFRLRRRGPVQSLKVFTMVLTALAPLTIQPSTAHAAIIDNGAYPNCFNQGCLNFVLWENHNITKNYSYTSVPVYPQFQWMRLDQGTGGTGSIRNRTLPNYFIMHGSPAGTCIGRIQDGIGWWGVANWARAVSKAVTLPAGCIASP